jgi:hypothetical protein
LSAHPRRNPGIVVSIATARDLVQWHTHLHLITTDGGKTAEGSRTPPPEWVGLLPMRLFRERLPASRVESHAISPELVSRLVGLLEASRLLRPCGVADEDGDRSPHIAYLPG